MVLLESAINGTPVLYFLIIMMNKIRHSIVIIMQANIIIIMIENPKSLYAMSMFTCSKVRITLSKFLQLFMIGRYLLVMRK